MLIEQVDAAELSPGEFAHQVRETVDEDNIKTVVIDSLNGYQAAMPEENSLILHIHELLQYLNRRGATTFMTVAQHGLVGDMKAPVDVTYLADTVILLRYFEAHGTRAARDVDHQEAHRHDTNRRFASTASTTADSPSASRWTEFQGVLRGVPTYSGESGPLLEGQGFVNRTASLSLRALMLAPNGRDARLTVLLLKEAGFAADVCGDISSLSHELNQGAGLAVIADEAIQAGGPRGRCAGIPGGAAVLVGHADRPADASRRRARTQSRRPAARARCSAT